MQVQTFADPSYVAVNNPFDMPWHFLGLELVVYGCFIMTVRHAWKQHREGDSFHLFQWLTMFVYGLLMELIAFNFMQNYHHGQFSVQLYHGELPLYITAIYLVFHYTGIKAVERLGLPLIKGGLLAGLAIMVIDVPFDSLGVDAGWWWWVDNSADALHPRFVEVLETRWFGVPVTSYYWYLMYGALLYVLSHLAWRRMERKGRSLRTRLLVAPLVSVGVVVGGALAFEVMFWLPRLTGLSDHAIVATYIGSVVILAATVRAPEAKPAPRWLLGNVAVFYVFHLALMIWLATQGGLSSPSGKPILLSAAALVAATIVLRLPLPVAQEVEQRSAR